VTIAAETMAQPKSGSLPDLIALLDSAAEAAGTLRECASAAVAAKVSSGGKLDGAAMEREQRAAHGLAWVATYVEAIREIAH
jgi:(2S)-methylsuccinyl-CoA dehydrogenase